MKKQKGITLIALVITIIVLLILAGVSIAMLTGDNGILNKAIDAKDTTSKAQIIENVQIDILAKQSEKKGGNLTTSELEDILNKYGTVSGDGDDKKLTTKEGNYEISVKDITGDIDVDGPNKDNVETQKPGLYDENDSLIVSWDELVNKYNFNIEQNYTSYSDDNNTLSKIIKDNNLNTAKKLIIDDTVTSIGGYELSGCENITSIKIANSVTSIGYASMAGCVSLTSIQLPNSVKSIDEMGFASCINLSNVELSNKLETIGVDAFAGCTSLTELTLPGSITKISEEAREGAFASSGLRKVILSEGITKISKSAFQSTTSLTEVILPSTLNEIENQAFSGCTNITNLVVPNTVNTIGTNAFLGIQQVTYSGTATGSPWGATNVVSE